MYSVYLRKTSKFWLQKSKISLNKGVLWSWIQKLSIVKMLVFPNLICRFYTILYKMLASYFVVINKLILRFIWKDPMIFNTILKKKKNSQRIDITKLQNYHNQHNVVLRKNRQIDQWNKIKSTEIDPHKYSQLIFDKRAKTNQWRGLFSIWCWSSWISTCQKIIIIYTDITYCIKITLKWIRDLKCKMKSYKTSRRW